MWRVTTVLELSGVSTSPVAFGDETKARGTAVHLANESLAHGYAPRVEDERHQPYVNGLLEFYAKFSLQVVVVERRIVNRMLGLTGRIDLIALVLIFGEWWPFIIDVKTGVPAPWHGLQTYGYKELAVHDDELWALFGPPFSEWDVFMRDTRLRRAVIYLPGNDHFLWAEQKDPQDGYLFKSALALLKWRHDRGLLTFTDLEQPADDHARAVHVLPVDADGVF